MVDYDTTFVLYSKEEVAMKCFWIGSGLGCFAEATINDCWLKYAVGSGPGMIFLHGVSIFGFALLGWFLTSKIKIF